MLLPVRQDFLCDVVDFFFLLWANLKVTFEDKTSNPVLFTWNFTSYFRICGDDGDGGDGNVVGSDLVKGSLDTNWTKDYT